MYLENKKYKNRYSFFEFITLGFSVIFTKVFYPKAKLIAYPVYMRGKKSLEYGKGFNVGYGCRFDLINPDKKTLHIGKNCELGDHCHIVATDNVTIGDNFLAASKVFISDTSHGIYNGDACSIPTEAPKDRRLVSKPVIIGDNVWIGDNVVILSGVHIGNGCVVGANSVVTKDINDNCIVAGVPARVIKYFNGETSSWEKIE